MRGGGENQTTVTLTGSTLGKGVFRKFRMLREEKNPAKRYFGGEKVHLAGTSEKRSESMGVRGGN